MPVKPWTRSGRAGASARKMAGAQYQPTMVPTFDLRRRARPIDPQLISAHLDPYRQGQDAIRQRVALNGRAIHSVRHGTHSSAHGLLRAILDDMRELVQVVQPVLIHEVEEAVYPHLVG